MITPRLQLVLGTLAFFVIFTMQVIVPLNEPMSSAVPEVHVHKGPISLWWSWTNGANKPRVSLNGKTMAEISGWASDIAVNGNPPKLLWLHYMGVKGGGSALYSSYLEPERYLLEQQVTIEDERHVRIRWYVTPYVFLSSVDLRLGYYRWRWEKATMIDRETFYGEADEIGVKITLGQNLRDVVLIREGDAVDYFDAYYRLQNVGTRTLITEVVIELGSGGSLK